MRRNPFLALAAILSAAAVPAQIPSAPPAPPPAPAAEAPKEAPKRDSGLYAVLTTSEGVIALKLFEEEAPVTVKNFVDLALGRKRWRDPKSGAFVTRPLYNGVTFHRVIPGFMIQGGDPAGNGNGDPGFVIPDEFHPALKYDEPGRVGMANAGPKTGNCQFFITEVPTPHLDGLHTIFGQVVEGQEVVNAIARAPRNQEDNKPLKPIRIVKVEILREGPAPPNAPEGKPVPAVKKAAPAAKKAASPAKPSAAPAKKTAAPATKK